MHPVCTIIMYYFKLQAYANMYALMLARTSENNPCSLFLQRLFTSAAVSDAQRSGRRPRAVWPAACRTETEQWRAHAVRAGARDGPYAWWGVVRAEGDQAPNQLHRICSCFIFARLFSVSRGASSLLFPLLRSGSREGSAGSASSTARPLR